MADRDVPVGVLAVAVQRALQAPSVHNTQPWRWRLTDGLIELHADPARQLVATDPDLRDLVLSCGAALHHLQVALAAARLSAHVHRLPSPEDRWHLATVRVRPGAGDTGLAQLSRAIDERRTDRRPFGADPVSPQAIGRLVACATQYGATLHPVTEPGARRRLDEVLADAGARQRFAPGYAAELTIWSHRWAAARDGIPATARTTRTAAPDLRAFPRGTLGSTRPQPAPGGHDGSVLLVLTTTGDEVLDHLLAGEATSAALLTATVQGLATTPLSQSQEVPATRARLASSVLRSPDRPQLVIRIGHPGPGASRIERTPRRMLEAVLMH
ncbi:Acg family FMN-binding oxidoreductase [Pseudonocardia abyssalis]|uniref:NAD(P)H nitroreductase n=1 Tax=Pseudonocardia abyssalis TaxID=2792008 RepID=A0ABS6UNE7_9PSEU|nr:NAD(P)H nitroreductase [Pseudonocardia abyssalis]MBW0116575.1 NAD(P)H nitroreductase [Pseudonocardia abyssalis]MBW0133777.1 NAD(P)H nitroreductase [Pseudonocardia abyssalis]